MPGRWIGFCERQKEGRQLKLARSLRMTFKTSSIRILCCLKIIRLFPGTTIQTDPPTTLPDKEGENQVNLQVRLLVHFSSTDKFLTAQPISFSHRIRAVFGSLSPRAVVRVCLNGREKAVYRLDRLFLCRTPLSNDSGCGFAAR